MNKNAASGPWQISNWYSDAGRSCGISNGIVGVAVVYGIGRVQAEANARLVAAAPELLASLRDCIQYMQWTTIEGGKAHSRALAVLHKATGVDPLDDAIEAAGGSPWI